MRNVRVLSFHGELDCCYKRSIEEKLGQIGDGGTNTVTILDLINVLYLDTTFLTALTRARKHLLIERPESSICIAARNNGLASRLFKITNLDQTYRMFDDMIAARRYAHTMVDTTALPILDVDRNGLRRAVALLDEPITPA